MFRVFKPLLILILQSGAFMPRMPEGYFLVDGNKTYELIDNMLKTLSDCFSSKLIHLGMDEAHTFGRGKYLDKYGYKTVGEIMKKH